MNLPQKKYQIIYADPPWPVSPGNTTGWPQMTWPVDYYPVMKTREICNLPIGSLADTDCALFMWTVSYLLPEAFQVMKAWGFTYVSLGFNWVKLDSQGKPYLSVGQYTRNNTELCLLGKKGSIFKLRPDRRAISQAILAPRTRHSEKPHEVRDHIVELFGDRPRIELFARHKVDGWDCWGNEV